MSDLIVEKIVCIVNENIEGIQLEINQMNADLTTLGMNSIDFIKIVVALEEEFSCQIPDSKLFSLEMNTISKIYEIMKPFVTK